MWNGQYLSGDVVRITSEFIEVSLDSPRQPMFHEKYQMERGMKFDLNTLWIHKQSQDYEIIAYVEDLAGGESDEAE